MSTFYPGRVYYHAWGDEEVMGSKVEIIHDDHEHYVLTFKQEGFEPELFFDVKINGYVLSKTDNSETDENGITNKTIVINFRAILNPRPEDLFEFVGNPNKSQ